MTKHSALISSPDRFLATIFLVFNFESKSILLMIWIELLVSKILMLSLVVSITIPIWFFEVLMRSSFLRLWTFYSQIISCLATSKFFLLTRTWLLLSVHITISFYKIYNTVPVLPISTPEITFTLWLILNLFIILSKGSSTFSFFNSLSFIKILAMFPKT